MRTPTGETVCILSIPSLDASFQNSVVYSSIQNYRKNMFCLSGASV
jgi:hypothetical protein